MLKYMRTARAHSRQANKYPKLQNYLVNLLNLIIINTFIYWLLCFLYSRSSTEHWLPRSLRVCKSSHCIGKRGSEGLMARRGNSVHTHMYQLVVCVYHKLSQCQSQMVLEIFLCMLKQKIPMQCYNSLQISIPEDYLEIDCHKRSKQTWYKNITIRLKLIFFPSETKWFVLGACQQFYPDCSLWLLHRTLLSTERQSQCVTIFSAQVPWAIAQVLYQRTLFRLLSATPYKKVLLTVFIPIERDRLYKSRPEYSR